MADESAENIALAESAADVADVKQELHCELGVFDIGSVKEADEFLLGLAAHASGDGKKVKAGIGGGAVCPCAVHSAGLARFFFQVVEVRHNDLLSLNVGWLLGETGCVLQVGSCYVGCDGCGRLYFGEVVVWLVVALLKACRSGRAGCDAPGTTRQYAEGFG